MEVPPEPADEQERLASLRRLGMLDTAPEERFDRLTGLGVLAFDVPMCLISLVDEHRQWFKSKVGIDATETSRDVSFCGHAILGDSPLIVADARRDPRFADNPLVCGGPNIRFYAGQPVFDRAGHAVGTLCILDTEPRTLSDREVALLGGLGRLVELELSSMSAEAANAEAEARSEWLTLITESVADGLVTIDRGGSIVAVNAAAERMFGYDRGELVGQSVLVLVPDHLREASIELLENQGDGLHLSVPRSAEARRRDGSSFPIELAVDAARMDGQLFYISRVTDETERRRAEEAQLASEELQRSVIASLDEGVLVISADGDIEQANDSAAAILRLPLDRIVGRNLAHLGTIPEFHFVDREGEPLDEAKRPIIRTLRHGEAVRDQVVGLERASGERTLLSVNSRVIGDGEPAGQRRAVLSFRDVTERLAVERMKDEFVAVVSHELRTPLTSIRGSLGLLASGRVGALDDSAQRMLEIAVSNTDRLIRLINDILDIERMRAHRVAFEKASVDVEGLVGEAMTVAAPLAERAGVTLRTGDVSGTVWADPDRIVQTLTNVVGNAVKFSEPGGTVEVWTDRDQAGVTFNVRDDGRGIPESQLEQIFGRFSQVDASDSRERGGSGLGLAICKEIVEQHDGRIWATSALGEGSTFSFTLPVAGPAARADRALADVGGQPT